MLAWMPSNRGPTMWSNKDIAQSTPLVFPWEHRRTGSTSSNPKVASTKGGSWVAQTRDMLIFGMKWIAAAGRYGGWLPGIGSLPRLKCLLAQGTGGTWVAQEVERRSTCGRMMMPPVASAGSFSQIPMAPGKLRFWGAWMATGNTSAARMMARNVIFGMRMMTPVGSNGSWSPQNDVTVRDLETFGPSAIGFLHGPILNLRAFGHLISP